MSISNNFKPFEIQPKTTNNKKSSYINNRISKSTTQISHKTFSQGRPTITHTSKKIKLSTNSQRSTKIDKENYQIDEKHKLRKEDVSPEKLQVAEHFANTVIDNLKSFKLIEKNGELCWPHKEHSPYSETSTGQNLTTLKNELIQLNLDWQDKIKNKLLISVRLKMGHNVKKKQGKTYIATFDAKGNKLNVAEKIELIGSGTFGNVYSYKSLKSNNEYALKLIKTREEVLIEEEPKPKFGRKELPLEDIQKAEKEILNEMEVLSNLHKDEIIPGLQSPPSYTVVLLRGNNKGIYESTKMGFFGTLYNGDASDFLDPENGWTIKHIFRCLKEMMSTLKHCHDQHIYHGDIKRENILKNDGKMPSMVIADFGGATNQKTNKFSHTPEYVHANDLDLLEEAMKKEGIEDYYSVRGKMDIFSIGVCIYYILTAEFPYPTNENELYFSNAKSHNTIKSGFADTYVSSFSYEQEMLIEKIGNCLEIYEETPVKEDISKLMGALIHQMVDENAKNRPSLEEILKTLDGIIELLNK